MRAPLRKCHTQHPSLSQNEKAPQDIGHPRHRPGASGCRRSGDRDPAPVLLARLCFARSRCSARGSSGRLATSVRTLGHRVCDSAGPWRISCGAVFDLSGGGMGAGGSLRRARLWSSLHSVGDGFEPKTDTGAGVVGPASADGGKLGGGLCSLLRMVVLPRGAGFLPARRGSASHRRLFQQSQPPRGFPDDDDALPHGRGVLRSGRGHHEDAADLPVDSVSNWRGIDHEPGRPAGHGGGWRGLVGDERRDSLAYAASFDRQYSAGSRLVGSLCFGSPLWGVFPAAPTTRHCEGHHGGRSKITGLEVGLGPEPRTSLAGGRGSNVL